MPHPFSRRFFLAAAATFTAARSTLLAANVNPANLGICTFSCHRAFLTLKDHSAPTPFSDGPSFYDYARKLGADGVQTGISTLTEESAKSFRAHVDQTTGYYEGDLSLPKSEADLGQFEHAVILTRLAGADVARTTLTGQRRYETFKTLDEFKTFHAQAPKRLALAEPIAKKHKLKLAIENHKDLTSEELTALMRQISSEWIGVNLDTGNNLALLEDPDQTIETLAPFAFTSHLKDMALQPHKDGFLLSEVITGQGFLDLPRIASTLRKSNPKIHLNLEMATRDPLLVPCLTDPYFATFPDRKATHLDTAMKRVRDNPLKHAPPAIAGKPMPQQLADEESNNRLSLQWMREHLAG